MARVDYLSDNSGDIQIANGDLVKGESDYDHIRMICTSPPCSFRQYPEVGFNAVRFTNAPSSRRQRFESELTEQLQADGYNKISIDLTSREWWKEFTVVAE